MNERGRFSPDQWRTLRFMPFWMLTAVAGAYRDFDVLLFEAFSRPVRSAAAAPGRLNRKVTPSVAADRPTIRSGLCEMAAIPGGIGPAGGGSAETALISEIGEGVARVADAPAG